jgi:hypothetical protein
MVQIRTNTKISDTQLDLLTTQYNQAKSVGNLDLAQQIAKSKQAWLCVSQQNTDHDQLQSLREYIFENVKKTQKSMTSTTGMAFKIVSGVVQCVAGGLSFGGLGAACLPSVMQAGQLVSTMPKLSSILSSIGNTGTAVSGAGTGISTIGSIPDSIEGSKQEGLRNEVDSDKNSRQETSQHLSSVSNHQQQTNQLVKEEEEKRSRGFSDMARPN